jgi:hypothetical protein
VPAAPVALVKAEAWAAALVQAVALVKAEAEARAMAEAAWLRQISPVAATAGWAAALTWAPGPSLVCSLPSLPWRGAPHDASRCRCGSCGESGDSL